MSAAIFNGSAVKILKDILRLKSGVELISDSDDPTVVAKNAPQGSLYIRQGTSDIYKKLDSGSSVNWELLPSSADLADYIPLTQKGAANGVASLDAGGKVPVAQLPNSIMDYLGTWDASTNTPTLADGTGNAGDVYIVSVAGTQNLGSGAITFAVSDWVVYSGTVWQKSINSNSVVSVNGYTGAVSLTTSDISEGTNLYFTNGRAQTAAVADSITDGVTNVAPSQNAVFDALAGKQPTITGAATTITSADLTASRALESNGSGKVAVSAVTSTELGYVSGVTSAIQTQLGGKANQALDNLTATAINEDLVFNKSSPIIKSVDNSGPTESLIINSGASSNDASGGIVISTSTAANDSPSGDIVIATSYVNGTGSVTKSGNIELTTGEGLSINDSGNMILTVGDAAGTRGVLQLITASIDVTNGNGTATAPELRLYEGDSNGTNYTAIKSPAALASNLTVQLPSTAGTSGQVLSTNGSGVTSWVTRGSGTVTSVGASAPLASSGGATPNISLTGQVDVANGGTGLATLTANNVILGNGTAAPTFVAPSTSGNVLTSNGTTWTSAAAPAVTLPTIQKFTSGSGTYTTPANVRYIKVSLVGAGGGGGGSGTASSGGTGGTGGSSTFGSSLLTAVGGVGGQCGNQPGGTGGAATVSSPAVSLVSVAGGIGGGGQGSIAAVVCGGTGGNSIYGGAGGGGPAAGGSGTVGTAGATNTGGGGGGAGNFNGTGYSGSGGGSGAGIIALITSPSATYAYAVGAAGTAGAATTSGTTGGAGGSGVIIVEEYY